MTSLYFVDYILLISTGKETYQNIPPTTSEDGNIKPPVNKSDLLKRLITTADIYDYGEIFNYTIHDGGALIHILQPKTVTTFRGGSRVTSHPPPPPSFRTDQQGPPDFAAGIVFCRLLASCATPAASFSWPTASCVNCRYRFSGPSAGCATPGNLCTNKY